MRRLTHLGLLIAVVLLVIAVGGYTAFWFVVAGRIADGIGQWAESLRPHKLDLSWRAIRVGGFPLALEVELNQVVLVDQALPGPAQVSVKLLTAKAHPWNFRLWRLAAPDGLAASLGPPDQPTAKLTSPQAAGSVAVNPDDNATIRFELHEPAIDAGMRLAAKQADLTVQLPPHPPQSPDQPAAHFTLDAQDLTLPSVPAPLRNPLDEITLGVTLLGPVPAALPRQAAAAWRDAGGTLELERVAVRWGLLDVTGSGTLALDDQLQPVGSFSGGIEGYDELLAALVAAGRLRANEANLARLALAFLAKRGPDGRPQISSSFTIQDGQMFLGPARLGPAPRIDWQ